MFSVFRGTKYDDIRPNHKKKKKQQKKQKKQKTKKTGFRLFSDSKKKNLIQ